MEKIAKSLRYLLHKCIAKAPMPQVNESTWFVALLASSSVWSRPIKMADQRQTGAPPTCWRFIARRCVWFSPCRFSGAIDHWGYDRADQPWVTSGYWKPRDEQEDPSTVPRCEEQLHGVRGWGPGRPGSRAVASFRYSSAPCPRDKRNENRSADGSHLGMNLMPLAIANN